MRLRLATEPPPLTGAPISTYFEGYCRHFGLAFKDAAGAEQKYAAHFDAEWRKRNCRGYGVILEGKLRDSVLYSRIINPR